MAISHVGAAIASGETVTLPAHQAGDLILGYGYTATGSVSLPAGWTNLEAWSVSAFPVTYYGRLAWKVAASGSESFGTWTNANISTVAVYRTTGTWRTPTFARWTTIGEAPPNLANPGGDNAWFVRMGQTDTPSGWTQRANSASRYALDSNRNITGDANSVGTNTDGAGIVTLGISDLAPTGLPVKVYQGGSWVQKPAKRWNGSAWVEFNPKVWTGSEWK